MSDLGTVLKSQMKQTVYGKHREWPFYFCYVSDFDNGYEVLRFADYGAGYDDLVSKYGNPMTYQGKAFPDGETIRPPSWLKEQFVKGVFEVMG